MSDRMLFDLMGVAGMASAFVSVWYMLKIERTIRQLHAVGGTVTEALITEPVAKATRNIKCGGLLRRTLVLKNIN